MTSDYEIAPEVITDLQRRCEADLTGEIKLDCADVAELLRVYQAWQDGFAIEPATRAES